jgi:DNA-cytosine methyltransferase
MPIKIDKKLIKTSETAKLLEISEASVKRWDLDGKITSCRTIDNHRVFSEQEIRGLKTIIDAKRKAPTQTEMSKIINPSPHPRHYLMHKYWGRKPHNVVSHYIKLFTNEGDKVLDPFMGSGVTIIESAKLKRNSIGVDLNPMSKFITDNTINKVNIPTYQIVFTDIYNKIYEKYSYMYNSTCPNCLQNIEFSSAVWSEASIARIRLNCTEHKKVIKDADSSDLALYNKIENDFESLIKNDFFPKDYILQYVKRSGNERIDELFSKRALIILSSFLTEIQSVQDVTIRNLLLFTFSSSIPNCSKMLPGDLKTGSYKSGWVISKFWVPKVHTERNVFECILLRYKAITKGKSETITIDQKYASTYTQDSKSLFQIQNESIDYIFTDPPYGESIAYLGLSHLWNSWLGFNTNFENEIIIDPFRKKRLSHFEDGMYAVFKELNRVLKTGKYMSFTFHNRDLKVWKAIIEPALQNGFKLVNVVMQPQAVSSGTQGLNRDNTLKGDFIYNFMKVSAPIAEPFIYHKNSYNLIVSLVGDFLTANKKATSAEVYEFLIPQIISNHAFVDEKNDVIDIEMLLTRSFIYEKDGNDFFWKKKQKNSERKIGVLDLFSGAGGFSIGFKKAGCQIISAIEFDKEISMTYKKNHLNTRMYNEDIRSVSVDDVQNDFIQNNIECDIIIGGPPCQGFSMAGNRIRESSCDKFDERNQLFMEFYRFVKGLMPKIFVIENVEGILNYNNGEIKEEIYKLFNDIGYNTESRVLLAADYGVPQLRKRAFFVGNRIGINSCLLIPDKTHSPEKYVTVWDAICDLPSIKSSEGAEILVKKVHEEYTPYQIKMGAHHLNVIYNHKASFHNDITINKMKLILNGKKQTDLPLDMQTKSVHSGSWGRMNENQPSYTLTTRINTPSVGRVIHPRDNRTITPREAARIQSFPDNFIFLGGITTIGKQIGNAVPPLLAEKIALNIIDKCF